MKNINDQVFFFFLQSCRCDCNEQPCVQTTGLYNDFYFCLVCLTFSISYSVLSFHLFQFHHLFAMKLWDQMPWHQLTVSPAFWIRNSASELKLKVCAMALSLYVSSLYCSQKIPLICPLCPSVIPDFLPLDSEGVLSQLITFALMDSVILQSQCSQSFG